MAMNMYMTSINASSCNNTMLMCVMNGRIVPI